MTFYLYLFVIMYVYSYDKIVVFATRLKMWVIRDECEVAARDVGESCKARVSNHIPYFVNRVVKTVFYYLNV